MDNWNDFLGKKVNVTVAFAAGFAQAGSVPHDFCGTIKSINDDSIVLSDASTIRAKGFSRTNTNINNILINKNYIILIEEI